MHASDLTEAGIGNQNSTSETGDIIQPVPSAMQRFPRFRVTTEPSCIRQKSCLSRLQNKKNEIITELRQQKASRGGRMRLHYVFELRT